MINNVRGETRCKRQLFPLGKLAATPGAVRTIAESGENPADFLLRHSIGDWGDLCKDDCLANDQALKEGYRIFSAYYTKNHVKIWVITEWDRSLTTILLPEEY